MFTSQQRGDRCSCPMPTEAFTHQHAAQLAAQPLGEPVCWYIQLAALNHAVLYRHLELPRAASQRSILHQLQGSLDTEFRRFTKHPLPAAELCGRLSKSRKSWLIMWVDKGRCSAEVKLWREKMDDAFFWLLLICDQQKIRDFMQTTTCPVLVGQWIEKLLPLQSWNMIQQIGDRWGDTGSGVTLNTRTGRAKHGRQGRAISRIEQRAVMVGRRPAQPGCAACKHTHTHSQHKWKQEKTAWNDVKQFLLNSALPEILKCPLSKTSHLSVARTSSSGLILRRPSVMTLRFLCRSYAFFEEKKVKLRLPRSWKTVPPPLRLRARGIPALLMTGRLHSVQGFWWRPMTTAGRFLQSNRMRRCCRSTLESIQSSRAKFWYTSVERETKISPAPLLNRSLLDVALLPTDWVPVRRLQTLEQPRPADRVLMRLHIFSQLGLFHMFKIFSVSSSVQLRVIFWLQQR